MKRQGQEFIGTINKKHRKVVKKDLSIRLSLYENKKEERTVGGVIWYDIGDKERRSEI